MPLLGAVDLGGTHTRYGLFTQDAQGGLRLERAATGMTALVKDAQSLREQWEASLGMPVDALGALVIGVAGPVSDPWHAVTSNADVRLDLMEWDAGQKGRRCPCRLANACMISRCSSRFSLTDTKVGNTLYFICVVIHLYKACNLASSSVQCESI